MAVLQYVVKASQKHEGPWDRRNHRSGDAYKLPMVDDLQTHSLSESSEELARCAVRMGYDAENRKKASESFHVDHQRYTEMVHRVFRSFFVEPMTSPVFKTMLRAIEFKH